MTVSAHTLGSNSITPWSLGLGTSAALKATTSKNIAANVTLRERRQHEAIELIQHG